MRAILQSHFHLEKCELLVPQKAVVAVVNSCLFYRVEELTVVVTGCGHKSARILSAIPLNGTGFRNDIPAARWIARPMICSHARAFTVNAISIPTSRGTFLLCAEGLNNVNAAEPLKAELNHVLIPRLGCFPSFSFSIPLRLIAMRPLQPLSITWVIRDANQQGFSSALTIYNRDSLLLPYFAKVCVLLIHGISWFY